jgi:hypothetical protein
MAKRNRSSDDYPKLRHAGNPEDVVNELGAALGELLEQLAADRLKRARANPQTAWQSDADRARRLAKQILSSLRNRRKRRQAINLLANVAADIQFSSVVRKATEAYKQKKGTRHAREK